MATIVGGLLLGASKRAAAEFSFFLSMPTMAGAFAYDLFKNRDVLSPDDALLIAIGFVCAFVAAVIGGIGHVPGAVVGGLLLGLIEEFVVGYTASTWRDAVAFGFLIVVLLGRPEGLFGKAVAEKV